MIETICTLFTSQEFGCTEFTVTRGPRNLRTQFTFAENGLGCRLTLLDEEILHNLKTVRLRSVLPPSLDSGDFTVELETGEACVYLRTIFELNRR